MLINETGKAILDDWYWGVIKRYQESTTSPRVSVRWSSPEVNRGDSAVVQSDIWSWACVAVQVSTEISGWRHSFKALSFAPTSW